MSEYVEFYLTTNPALLPCGVKSTIAHMQEQIESRMIVEILYEPKVPWFKIIALAGDRDKVFGKLQSYLEKLLEDEVVPLEDDLISNLGSDGAGAESQADLKIDAQHPHVVPWALYQQQRWEGSHDYDEFRFPEPIQVLHHKSTWRGLELFNGLSIMDLLLKYSFIHPDPNQILDKIGWLTKCQFTHNMKGTLVYIGSEHGPECSEKAIQKLTNLLSLQVATTSGSSHLIFTESDSPPKLSFRYFTHLGLDRLTYPNAQISEVPIDFPTLTEMSTLRTCIIDKNGNPQLDNTIYAMSPRGDHSLYFSFGPFADFIYPVKSRGFVATSEPKRPIPNSILEKNSDQSNSTIPHNSDSDMFLEQTSKFRGHRSSSRVRTNKSDKGSGAHEVFKGKSHANNTWIERSTMSNVDKVANWMAGLKSPATSRRPESQPQLLMDEPMDLLSDTLGTGSSHTYVDCTHPGNVVPNLVKSTTQPNDSHLFDPIPDTMMPVSGLQAAAATRISESLLDSDPPPGLLSDMFSPLNVTLQRHSNYGPPASSARHPQESNLMDSCIDHIFTPALMDIHPQKNNKAVSTPAALQGVVAMEDEPNGDTTPIARKRVSHGEAFIETMRQKSGVRKTWAQALIGECDSKMERGNSFGANVAIKIKSSPSARKREASLNKHSFHDYPPVPKLETTPTKIAKTLTPGLQQPPATSGQTQTPGKPEGLDEVLDGAQDYMKDMFSILQLTPGRINLEARFGRLCIKNLSPSLVNMGTGPYWDAHMVLNSFDIGDENIGFHTVLTTNGMEAEILPTTATSKGKRWTLNKRDVHYDFICQSKEDGDRKVVEIDASNFEYSCRPVTQELPGLYIHCTKRAWDLRVGVTRLADVVDDVPANFRDFAGHLVRSLVVTHGNEDQIHFEVEHDASKKWSIEKARVRHIVKYNRSTTDSVYLCLTMTRVIHGKQASNCYRGVLTQGLSPGECQTTQWFDASVRSAKADALLSQNEQLQLGDKASWSPDDFEGAIKAICRPALQMITQMDEIGRTNDNDQRLKLGQRCSRGLSETDPAYVFW
ncbi:hypothetical protein BGZ63DRAFT_460831 [Mariannaea sp. PMI_226]|nr:hypothetical protein BGZ63DRAFT_460831 [Mariannaea sp. PMI_226]